jgi:23S rRNA pseudouridine1911/1915/1917 synthase
MAQNLSPLELLSEDDHLLAVVKPAGLPSANAPRNAPSAFRILQAARPGRFLGVVSRLDAPVSGVLVVAASRPAAAELARQFRERLVHKTYLAVVEGRFPAPLGQWVEWHDRIERFGEERRSRLLPSRGLEGHVANDWLRDQPGEEDEGDQAPRLPGQAAECHVRARVVRRAGEVSLVELEPSTGRRHQLRAQLAGRGCPIVGDRTYGGRLPFASSPGLGPAIALHAARLRLVHPATATPVVLRADVPSSWDRRFPSLCSGGRISPSGGAGGPGAV